MATTTIVVHRDERRLIGLDFAPDLKVPLDSVDYVRILDPAGVDVTAELRGDPAVAPILDPTGYIVSVWKEERAAPSEQQPGTYRVKCRGISSDGEKPIVLGEGDRLILLKIVGD